MLLAGKSTDGKKSKEPDITIAMFRKGKELTLYQPNMHRVEVEDMKGLERSEERRVGKECPV